MAQFGIEQGIQLHANGDLDDIKSEIICDSGSSIAATFVNPKFLENIRKAETPMQMSTNAGCKKLTHIGDVRGFGEAWYDPKNIANVFGVVPSFAESSNVTDVREFLASCVRRHLHGRLGFPDIF